jgi:hypothetical protein
MAAGDKSLGKLEVRRQKAEKVRSKKAEGRISEKYYITYITVCWIKQFVSTSVKCCRAYPFIGNSAFFLLTSDFSYA